MMRIFILCSLAFGTIPVFGMQTQTKRPSVAEIRKVLQLKDNNAYDDDYVKKYYSDDPQEIVRRQQMILNFQRNQQQKIVYLQSTEAEEKTIKKHMKKLVKQNRDMQFNASCLRATKQKDNTMDADDTSSSTGFWLPDFLCKSCCCWSLEE